MKDRFDLETEIHNVWDTEKDLDTILYRMMDASAVPSEDEITNMLIGLKEIHSSRCMKLWDIFEDMAHNKCFKHPEEELLGFATDKEAGFEATKMPMEAPFILEDEGKSDDDLMGDKNWRDYVTENLEQPETKGTIKEQPSSDDPLKVAVNAMDDQENIRNIKLWNNIRKEMETGSSKKN